MADIRIDLKELIARGRKFPTIYADPPWRYRNTASRGAACNHYPTMTVEEIAALPVADVCEDDAHLFLWTTSSFLPDAIKIVRAWGFRYEGGMVWVKPQMGLGNYFRISSEFMFLGVRGELEFADKNQRDWIMAPRTKHSEKPEIFREKIELVSPGPYLELFGRRTANGWTVLGNEIGENLVSRTYAGRGSSPKTGGAANGNRRPKIKEY